MIKLGKVGKALTLASAIALGSAGVAFSQGAVETSNSNSATNPKPSVKTEQVVSQPSIDQNYWTADGILTTPSIVELSRNKNYNIDELISGGNVTSMTSPNPISYLNGKLNFLENSQRAKDFYAPEARQRMIRVYENLINKVQKINANENGQGRELSRESLEKAVQDRFLTKTELENITSGVYVIDKKGWDSKVGNYDAPMLVYIPPKTQEAKSETQSSPSEYKTGSGKPSVETNNENAESKKSESKSNLENKTLVDLNFSANSDFSVQHYGFSLGTMIRPFKNKNIGFGGAINASFGGANLVNYYVDHLPNGISTLGTMTEEDYFSISPSLEFQLGPVFIGGGPEYVNYNTVNYTEIDQNGAQIKNNTDTISNEQKLFGRFYAGLSRMFSNFLGGRLAVGYDGKTGAYAEFGVTARLNPEN